MFELIPDRSAAGTVPSLPVSSPGDATEREADRLADAVLRMPAPAAGSAVRQSTEAAGVVPGPGRPLGSEVRAFFEPRFGHDFSRVRVHDGPAAAASARGLGALAYTVDQDIVFGAGHYAPSTSDGRRILAHELAHTVQQTGTGARIARLTSSMCAAHCDVPEGVGAATGRYELTVFADKEGAFLGIPLTENVGHSWVRLTDDGGRYWSYGFWPETGFTGKKVDDNGCVHSPDGPHGNPPHHPTASRSFELTVAQFAAAKAEAISVCASRPKYNLFGLQCTEFVRRVLQAAGQAPALGFGLLWESPNALDTWIRTHALTLGGTVGSASWTVQLTYTHQFYALLGEKLRLHWMSRGELGPRLSTVSTGVSVEATTDRVFLPSAYVFGAGLAGGVAPAGGRGQQFAAGLTAGAGLQYRIDEIGTVGVEYHVIKDLVNGEPDLRRLMVTAGIRLW